MILKFILILCFSCTYLAIGQCEYQQGYTTAFGAFYQFPQKRNYFDWTVQSFPMFFDNKETTIQSPFYQSNNPQVEKYFNEFPKDNSPLDGWELIKENFGYIYNNYGGKVRNGNGVANPYFILYNKYTGVLRVFLAIGNRNQDYQKYKLTLSYLDGSGRKIGNNISSYYNNHFNEPLNQFPKDKYGDAQDMMIIHTDDFPIQSTSTNLLWLTTDYNVGFDPCNCSYKYGFKFIIELLKIEDVFENGVKIGVSTRSYNFGYFAFELPGSNSGNFTNVVDGFVPYYNYPLGIATLIKTPKVYYTFSKYWGAKATGNKDQDWEESWVGEFRSYLDINTINYAINENVFDVKNSKVYVSLEMENGVELPNDLKTATFTKQPNNTKLITDYIPIDSLVKLHLNYIANDYKEVPDWKIHNEVNVKDFYVNVMYVLQPLNNRQKSITYKERYKLNKEFKEMSYEDGKYTGNFDLSFNSQDNLYKQYVTDTAKYKIRGLVSDLYNFCSSNKNDDYLPEARRNISFQTDKNDNDITLNSSVSVNDGISVFPNPATNKLNLALANLKNRNLEIKVYDILGIEKILLLNQTRQELESYVYKFDISILENGTYFVEINIEGQIERIPIVILK